MKDTSGKVILSLLAGATAGVVAGLLLAPETGEETRTGLKKSASKWSDDLGKLLKDSLALLNTPKTGDTAPNSSDEGRSAADELLKSMSQDPGGSASAASGAHQPDTTEETINPEASGTSEYGRSL